MPILKKVAAENYLWEKLYDLSGLLTFLSGLEKDDNVTVINSSSAMNSHGKVFDSYGDTLSYIQEAVEFKGGKVLICATVSSWAGTFASHDDIQVVYYGLTPASHKANKRKA